MVRSGNQLVVNYIPASRFWTLQFIEAGLFLAIAAASLGTPCGCSTARLPEGIPRPMPVALIPVLVLAAAFVVFCLVDLERSDQKVLPKWAWAIIICGSVPLGGLAYLFFTKSWS